MKRVIFHRERERRERAQTKEVERARARWEKERTEEARRGFELARDSIPVVTEEEVRQVIDRFTPLVNTTKTAFHCIGIAIIGGVLFYILGGKKKGKD